MNDALESAEIARLIGRPDPTILDIGCNDGTHTRMFLDLFDHGRVFSFEPDPRARERFRRDTTDPRAQLFPIAIGASDGVTQFHQSSGDGVVGLKTWDYSGSIRKPKLHLQRHPWCRFDSQIAVPIMRLDTWAEAQGVTDVDFIWADMQGAEVDLIIGGSRILDRTRFLYTEYSDEELYEGEITLQQILQLLPHFEVVHRYADDVLLRHRS
jgi:FkbM family methyltransferase